MRLSLYFTEVPVASRLTMAAREIRGTEPGAVVAYHPVARLNPFQSLLYSSAFETGFAPVGVPNMEDLESLVAARAMGTRALLHLHWTSPVIGSAQTEEEAQENVDGFLAIIERLKSADVALLWTVHNRLPHHCRFPQTETQLRRSLVEAADAIHVMEATAIDAVSDVVVLPPSKTFVVPHPSYLGAYPTHFDRSVSRLELGISRSDFVVGLIGSIQPYKGIDELVDAADEASSEIPNLRVLIAGIPGSDPESEALIARLEATESVISLPSKLDDRNMSRLLSSLDMMALPYRSSLTSGAALLALTFGLPIIAPSQGPFQALIEEGFGLGYDMGNPSGLMEAIEEAPRFIARVDRAAMARHVEGLEGRKVSEQFFTGLRDVLGW